MIYVSIVTETSQEAYWNRQTGRQTDTHDHVLSQADTLTKKRHGNFDANLNVHGKHKKPRNEV